jgi:hypothetical protein
MYRYRRRLIDWKSSKPFWVHYRNHFKRCVQYIALFLGMHRILILPDIRPAGYPVNLKAGYQISGLTSGEGRIPDIRPDFQLNIQMCSKIWNKRRHQMCWRFFPPYRTLDIPVVFCYTSKQYWRKHFWKFNELIWLSLQCGQIIRPGYPVHPYLFIYVNLFKVRKPLVPNSFSDSYVISSVLIKTYNKIRSPLLNTLFYLFDSVSAIVSYTTNRTRISFSWAKRWKR